VRIIVVLLVGLMVATTGFAQLLPAFGGSRSGTTGLQFLKLGPDARSNALAGAVVGEINDEAAVFWNPAGIVELDTQKLHIQTGHTAYFAGVGINHASVVYQPERFRSFGIGLMNMRSPEMPVTTEFMPLGTGQTFSVNDLLVSFSYAQVLTENFRFGATLKYANENIAGVVAQAGLIDFGFQYEVGVRDLMFGVAISNFGFNVTPGGEIGLVGISGNETTIDNFEEFSVPASFKMGFSGTAYEKGMHKVRALLQLNHPTDNQESLALAFEYSRNGILYLRTGYALGQAGTYPSLGGGINLYRRFGNLRIDYAFLAKNSMGISQQVTLAASIW